MIELRRVFRYFGQTRAVHDVSFDVQAGTVCGYIGPNGAGKTTSMRILATLDVPTGGDAYVDGFSCVLDPDRVRSRLGYMPDAYGTYSDVNCLEYLDFFARSYGLVGRERSQAIRRVLDFTRLEPLAEKPIDGLSKGMKQRLCLGRALIHDPAVLVMDEPAAGLDPRARIELRDMIGQLAADGKTVLISSHILTELGEMCHQVAIIEQGQLLAVGSVDQIRRGQEPRNAVRIELLGPADPLAEWLRARGAATEPGPFKGIGEAKIEGASLTFPHPADRAAESQMLREIVMAGFPVIEFGSHETSLEEVFMRVTEGQTAPEGSEG